MYGVSYTEALVTSAEETAQGIYVQTKISIKL
jgi:hypothetical protein